MSFSINMPKETILLMKIRRATKKDVLQLSELFRQNIEYHQELAGYFELLPEFDWISYTQEKLKYKNRIILVAEHSEDLAGFVAITIKDYPPSGQYKSILHRIIHYIKKTPPLPIKYMRWGFIEDCYVLPSRRKQGIGNHLILGAKKWLQSKQVSRIELSLIANNKEGKAFWKKAGFKTFRFLMSKEI